MINPRDKIIHDENIFEANVKYKIQEVGYSKEDVNGTSINKMNRDRLVKLARGNKPKGKRSPRRKQKRWRKS